jgi:hypothetical protein
MIATRLWCRSRPTLGRSRADSSEGRALHRGGAAGHGPATSRLAHPARLHAGPQAGVELSWRRASTGRQRSRFLGFGSARPGSPAPPGGRPCRRRRVGTAGALAAVEWPTDTAEPVTYWLSNLPETTPLQELVRLGKLRWRMEQDDRELKGALGLDHFEVAASAAGSTM